VTEKILSQHELFRNERFMLQFGVGAVGHAERMRTIELFGTIVAPAVRAALANEAEPRSEIAEWQNGAPHGQDL
jgi:hypothetical protein